MEEDKMVTTMVLKVDLQCEKCYKKVKKVLCKFPQIRDQTYDVKNNQVTIKVVCCSPEKFRDKLYCKGRCVIKCIEIKKDTPPKPTPAPPPDPSKTKPTPPPAPEPPKPPPKTCTCRSVICTCALVICICPPVICTCLPVPRQVKCQRPPGNTCCTECSRGQPGGPCQTGRPLLANTCCTECSRGQPGGPCQTGYGYGVLCPYYCGRPGYDCYCVTRPNCFSEENSQVCAIM